jgi:hypothetical protein
MLRFVNIRIQLEWEKITDIIRDKIYTLTWSTFLFLCSRGTNLQNIFLCSFQNYFIIEKCDVI